MESSMRLQQLQVFPSVFPVWLWPPGLPCPFAMFEGELCSRVLMVLSLTRAGLGAAGEELPVLWDLPSLPSLFPYLISFPFSILSSSLFYLHPFLPFLTIA